MSMNVNQVSSANSWSNVDVSNINQVTQSIMERSTKTIDLNNVDLSKFQRASKGIDLYNPNVSIDTQRQVSMINAGLTNTANVNTVYLNAQAANELYANNVSKAVEGKMTINIQEGELQALKEVGNLPSMTEVFSTSELSKDKRGSNPFYYAPSSDKKEKDGLDLTV